MNQELKTLLDTKANEIIDRIKKNLQSRGLVGQKDLVKDISYELREANGIIDLVFVFDRQEQRYFKQKNSTKFLIRDPLFGVNKEYAKFARERLAFTRKANIYDNLTNKYFDEIIDAVTEQKMNEYAIRVSNELG